MLYLTSDHGGFNLKNKIKNHLEKKDVKYIDLGPFEIDLNDDFPLYAKKMAEAMRSPEDRGIAVCKSGVGMVIALNKFKGVRAGEIYNTYQAKKARTDDDANVLVLGSEVVTDDIWPDILDVWLNTGFAGEERFIRRIQQIQQFEE